MSRSIRRRIFFSLGPNLLLCGPNFLGSGSSQVFYFGPNLLGYETSSTPGLIVAAILAARNWENYKMFRKAIFSLFAIISTSFLIQTITNLIYFVSSQNVRGNDLDAPTLTLITIDVCLVVLFMAQHSGLATSVYREVMEFLHLKPITRSVYTCLTALALQFMMNKWQTIDEIQFWLIDTRDHPLLWLFFHILHWTLWILSLLQVLFTSPLELTGIRQVWNFVLDILPRETRFQQFLKHMPHTGSGCFVALLWIHPCMTFDRMILATVLTAYLWTGFSVTNSDYVFLRKYSNLGYTRSSTNVQRSYRHQIYR